MKRILSLLLVLAMCMSLCACGEVNLMGSTKPLVVENDGVKCINSERFGECLEVIELTLDNWKDYIDVITYSEEIVNKDAFGEVISTETEVHHVFGVNTELYYYYEDVAIELENVETCEKTIYEFTGQGNSVSEDFDLSKYECTRIKGKIYFVDLPEEVIYSPLPEWNYKCGFILESGYDSKPYAINGARAIGKNGREQWDEDYMK